MLSLLVGLRMAGLGLAVRQILVPVSLYPTPQRSSTQRHGSMMRQRTTPSTAGSGPVTPPLSALPSGLPSTLSSARQWSVAEAGSPLFIVAMNPSRKVCQSVPASRAELARSHPFRRVGDREQTSGNPAIAFSPRPPGQFPRTDVIPDHQSTRGLPSPTTTSGNRDPSLMQPVWRVSLYSGRYNASSDFCRTVAGGGAVRTRHCADGQGRLTYRQ